MRKGVILTDVIFNTSKMRHDSSIDAEILENIQTISAPGSVQVGSSPIQSNPKPTQRLNYIIVGRICSLWHRDLFGYLDPSEQEANHGRKSQPKVSAGLYKI